MIGTEKKTQLDDREVSSRLESYGRPETTVQLYTMGFLLTQEALQRFDLLSQKVERTASYGGAIIALLVTALLSWSKAAGTPGARWLVYAALLLLAGGSFIALRAAWPMTIEWISPDEWFQKDCLGEGEKLRKYHLLAMYGARQSHVRACARKARAIQWAWGLLVAGFVLLLAAALCALDRN